MSSIVHARQRYSEFEVFSESARDWNFDFRQLDRGPLTAEHAIVGTATTQIMHVQLGRKFHQFGAAPAGGCTIAVVDHASSPPEWCGRPIAQDTMPIFAADGTFEAVSHPGFNVFTVSVSDDCMIATAETHDLQRGLDRFGGEGIVVNCHRAVLDRLRNRISQVFRLAGDPTTQEAAGHMQSVLEREVPRLILRAAVDGLETKRKSVRPRLRGRALRLALEYIEANSGSYISLEDLCDATGASARTLRYAFHDRFDVPPVGYLIAHRLNAIRRQLASHHHQAVSIQDVARENGFHHMGQFATAYKKMFGENPSETLSNHSN